MAHRIVRVTLSGVLLLTGAQTKAPERADTGFDVVITVDDLPAHGALPAGTTRLEIANRYLATLKRHHVPEAFGFVNAAKLAQEPGNDAVLGAWREAEYPLGNHTFSHLNLDSAASLDA